VKAVHEFFTNTRMDGTIFVHSWMVSCFAGVVRRVESLPLALLGDFVRGRMSEGDVSPSGERQAPCRACRDIEGLFESLLSESFS